MTDLVLAPKQAIAVIVMIAFIMVCVFAPFGAAHAIVGISTAAITILIAGLAAIGITFASTGGFDTLNDYVESLLQEYATDNNIPVTSVFNGTQFSSSAAGKILLNNRFVMVIDTFAQWLIGKYNLTNNNFYTFQSTGTTLDGMTLYGLPFELRYSSSVYTEWTQYIGTGAYAVLMYNGNNHNQVRLGFLSESESTVMQVNGYGQTQVIELVKNESDYLYHRESSAVFGSEYNWSGYDVTTPSTFRSSFIDPNAVIDENNIGIGVGTGSISFPTDNLDYTSGDGAILDVGARWGESTGGAVATVPEIWPQWLPGSETLTSNPDITIEYEAEAVIEESLPQPSDIENLPGATIPGLPNIDGEPWHFEFSNLWHYVAQWISDMSAGGAVIWNTCIQAPPAIINLVFAGIVLAMWFGAIKILR